MINLTHLDGGIARLEIATPGPANTLSKPFNEAFLSQVEGVAADQMVKGILLASAKDDFAVGGDLDELYAATSPQDISAIVDPFGKALRVLETCGKPVAAALNGSALGGGYEIALAAHRRFAASMGGARFGLPESGLGLMPGAGGTQRLPRMIGIAEAGPLILQGKTLGVNAALEAGLIDEIVPIEALEDIATDWLRDNPEAVQPWDVRGFKAPGFDPQDKKGRMWFGGAWAQSRKIFGGSDAPGTAILYALHHGMERRFDAALAVERRKFLELASGQEAKNKIRARFFGPKALKPKPYDMSEIKKLGVIGGGVMGCGIAFAAARAGFDVSLIDLNETAAASSFEKVEAIAARQVKRGRLDEGKAEAILSKVSAGADYSALEDADFVIEAVFERADVKDDVLKRVESATRADVPVASNTSTMPIAGLAESLKDPSRMVGMHFFSPVETMPLLEIIHTPSTSQRVKELAEGIGAALRKSVVTVNDGLGFYTSRVVSSLTGETVILLSEGVPPQLIDNVMKTGGFMLGPATLIDLTTVPLLKDIMTSMTGEGIQVSLQGVPVVATLTQMADAGRVGKVNGSGIYDYEGKVATPWPGLIDLFGENTDIDADDVANRLWCAQSLEAWRALEEGVVTDKLAADAAATMGWGYPAHMGGPFAYIDTVGRARFVETCDHLAETYGPRFAVPQSLRASLEAPAMSEPAE